MKSNIKDNTKCKKYRPQHQYTHTQEFIDNLPYIIMTILGAIILILGFKFSLLGILAALIFIIYSIIGTFSIIIFVCPYCRYYDTRACPCGYGQIAAKLVPEEPQDRFIEKFRSYIPFIVPIWIIPFIMGLIFLYIEFSWLMLILVIIFILDSFIILPLVSRKYGCAHCPQKDSCPWMK
jgi:hypothetical protein